MGAACSAVPVIGDPFIAGSDRIANDTGLVTAANPDKVFWLIEGREERASDRDRPRPVSELVMPPIHRPHQNTAPG